MTSYCETALFQLSLLLDGELEGALQKKLEGHLVSCAECSQTREDLEKNEILLRDSVESLFDSSFSETLLQQVKDRVALSKESYVLNRYRLFHRNQNRFS
ncbi:MAG: zf-HC2 domain-containing protein, partial [Planctomycetota bacterium]